MIKLVRLDYRLLHGQVVFSWTGHVGAQRIIVVDDDAANDEMKKSALLLSKPAGVRVNIFTVDKAIAKMPKVEQLDEKIMMIFGNTAALLKFCQAYPKIKEINYGAVANKPGSKAFDQSVFLTPEEQADTQKLLDMGIKIYSQQTPTFKVVEGFDKYDKMIEGLTNVFEAAENAANSARKSAKEFAEKYKDAPVVYVMSSGASMEVAYSTSICLMMEMQWVNSGSFHSGEFFHGPFEIVDKDVPFILLMNDGKTRPVDARALTFLHRFDALTTVVDAKDYGLGNAVDSSVITYFNPLMHTAVFRVYAEELSYVRQHPLTLRRYMWKLEY